MVDQDKAESGSHSGQSEADFGQQPDADSRQSDLDSRQSDLDSGHSASDSPQSSYKEKIYLVLHSVPSGKVVTYGQVASLCGMGNGARAVGRSLKGLPKNTSIPWHRVLNSQGRISVPEPGANAQKERLQSEGVLLINGRVNLKQYQWRP